MRATMEYDPLLDGPMPPRAWGPQQAAQPPRAIAAQGQAHQVVMPQQARQEAKSAPMNCLTG